MWQNFQKFIPKAAGKYNFAHTLKSIEVCQACRELILTELPLEAELHVSPKSFKDGVLTIETANPSWANQVQMASHRIHRGLKDKFGERSVKKVRIVPASTPGPRL